MHGYAHFAEFGGPINSVVKSKKNIKCTETRIQCYPNLHLSLHKVIFISFSKKKERYFY